MRLFLLLWTFSLFASTSSVIRRDKTYSFQSIDGDDYMLVGKRLPHIDTLGYRYNRPKHEYMHPFKLKGKNATFSGRMGITLSLDGHFHVVKRSIHSKEWDRAYDIYNSSGQRIAQGISSFGSTLIFLEESNSAIAKVSWSYWIDSTSKTLEIYDDAAYAESGLDPLLLPLMAIWEMEWDRHGYRHGTY